MDQKGPIFLVIQLQSTVLYSHGLNLAKTISEFEQGWNKREYGPGPAGSRCSCSKQLCKKRTENKPLSTAQSQDNGA
jgi:hypothetical protein